ncbi:hypothetical protein CesoFtcFv8_009378 [Champsocephalus esox]|uniref:Uncharacterized protein n=1 Tax=Champsocephalus esox TaxID=159716 RepID=A0AAN8CAG6_9TELE|nr:hypothetical protein CesoFtcFv8_009378 [Champsocephalus esox]
MPPIFTISVGCLTAHGGTENTIQQAVEKEERPMPDERRAFVNALVDQMMQHERNPIRAICHSIVRLIVRSHPKSFADISR